MTTGVLGYPGCETAYRKLIKNQYRSLAQHSWAWQKILAEWGDMKWNAIGICDSTGDIIGCIPFCVKETEIGRVIMSSPLPASYGGVLHIEECEVETVYQRLLTALVSYGREEGADLISIFTSPFRYDLPLYMKYFEPDYVVEKFYQYMPKVSEPTECSVSKFRNNLKRNIRKANEYGLKVVHPAGFDEMQIKRWYNDVVCSRFCDIGVNPAPERFYLSIVRELAAENLAEFLYVLHEGKTIGGGICIYGWCQDIYLRVASTGFLSHGAGMLLDYEIIKRGIQRGVNAHNFQSSPSRESPSYTYKKQWGCFEDNTYYLVKVLKGMEKFLHAGKDAVRSSFEYFFVLPYSVYGVI